MGVFLSQNLSAQEKLQSTTQNTLPYRHALYYFFQDKNLAAITLLELAKSKALKKNNLLYESSEREIDFLLGSLYFEYGLSGEAEKAFQDLLANKTQESLKNKVWFNLARVNYQRAEFDKSESFLEYITAPLTPKREAEKKYFDINLLLKKQQFEAAILKIKSYKRDNIWAIYSYYNLGAALLNQQQVESALLWLNKVTQYQGSDAELLALKDGTYFMLGLYFLREQQPQKALDYLSKIQIESLLSKQAILASGWAYSQLPDLKDQKVPNQQKALGYWRYLQNTQSFGEATQEALLALALHYQERDQKHQALQYYQFAEQLFGKLLSQYEQINDLIGAEQLQLNQQQYLKLEPNQQQILRLLFADFNFQQEIRRLNELLAIQQQLNLWDGSLPTLGIMLEQRQKAFQLKKPQIEQSIDLEQLAALKAKRDDLAQQVETIETEKHYLELANEEEADALDQLAFIESIINKIKDRRDTSDEQATHDFLKGIVSWQVEIEFTPRLWQMKRQVQLLNRALDQADQAIISLADSSKGNEQKIQSLANRLDQQLSELRLIKQKVDTSLQQQKQHLRQFALSFLDAQKQLIVKRQINARYSIAVISDELSKIESAL